MREQPESEADLAKKLKSHEQLTRRQLKWPKRVDVSEVGPELRNLRYVNEEKIDSLLVQLGFDARSKSSTRKFGLRGLSPEASQSSVQSETKIPIEKRIAEVIDRLRETSKLTGERPAFVPHYPGEEPPFVIERCNARQFVFPRTVFKHDLGISALKLWVSEPDATQFVDKPFYWDSAYLILTEVHFDNSEHRMMVSGCSALRLVANAIENKQTYHREGEEVLGRWDKRPMTEKIMTLGGIPGSSLPIETLYSIRYMTDEQYDPRAPQEGRVHDILGYPLFISSAV